MTLFLYVSLSCAGVSVRKVGRSAVVSNWRWSVSSLPLEALAHTTVEQPWHRPIPYPEEELVEDDSGEHAAEHQGREVVVEVQHTAHEEEGHVVDNETRGDPTSVTLQLLLATCGRVAWVVWVVWRS